MTTRLELARQHLQQGQYAEALELAQKLLRLGQQVDDAHNVAGTAALRSGDMKLACRHFETLVRLHARHPGTWLNLALASIEARDFDRAGQATRRMIELAPTNAEYRFMLVTVLVLAGKGEEILPAIEATLAVDPAYPEARFARFETLSRTAPLSEWPALWAGLDPARLPPMQSALLLLAQLIHAWLCRAPRESLLQLMTLLDGAIKRFTATLEAGGGLQARQGQAMRRTLAGYFGMFIHLLRQPMPPAVDPTLPRLWLVGDSHVLPPQGQLAPVSGRVYQVDAQLVMGCKLWHLAMPGPSLRRQALAARLAAAPAGVVVAVSLGEIDLRADDGIWALTRRGRDWRELVAHTVAPAVAWLAAHKGPQALVVLGVPLPQEGQLQKLPEAERTDYLEMVAAANQALAEAARARGFGFVDLYAFTAGRPELFLDGIHLVPGALPAALEATPDLFAGQKSPISATEAA